MRNAFLIICVLWIGSIAWLGCALLFEHDPTNEKLGTGLLGIDLLCGASLLVAFHILISAFSEKEKDK